jgi:hypothetical protein
MPRLQRDTDLAVWLEASYARAMPGSRVNDNEGPLLRVNRNISRGLDTHENIICRPRELAAIHLNAKFKLQDVWRGLRNVFTILLAAPAKDIQEKDAALARISPVTQCMDAKRKKIGGRDCICLLLIW